MENITIPWLYEHGQPINVLELHKSIFLRNLLEPYYDFEVRRGGKFAPLVHIYEIKGPGIKEEVSTGQLIYFMHCELPALIQNRLVEMGRERADFKDKHKKAKLYEHQTMYHGGWITPRDPYDNPNYNPCAPEGHAGPIGPKGEPTEIKKTLDRNELNVEKIQLIKACYYNYFSEVSSIHKAVNNISILLENTNNLKGEEEEEEEDEKSDEKSDGESDEESDEKSDESFDKMRRSEQIAKDSFEVGRNPLDTAGLDTDDEVWLHENPDCEDYIMEVWSSFKNSD